MTVEIRRDEWLAELERVMAAPRPLEAERPRGSFTADEAARALGRPHSTIMRWLNDLDRAGRLQKYGRLPTGKLGIDLRRKVVATYGLLPLPKGQKAS